MDARAEREGPCHMPVQTPLLQLVRADLERAQRLVRKIHPEPIDPQFRIASPDGDWWIAITLTENAKERRRRLRATADCACFSALPRRTA